MKITKWSETIMAMSDATWERHANPWSVYSRFTALPLLSLALWSREWIGVLAVIPVVLSILWIWVNPRLFGKPKTTNNWASMGTFGERIYLKLNPADLPAHHRVPCKLLQLLSALGIPFFLYGAAYLHFWSLLLGNILIMVFKTWFVDRMVWLYLDMKDKDAEYQAWLRL